VEDVADVEEFDDVASDVPATTPPTSVTPTSGTTSRQRRRSLVTTDMNIGNLL
jgi:hypothetical protein